MGVGWVGVGAGAGGWVVCRRGGAQINQTHCEIRHNEILKKKRREKREKKRKSR